MSAKTILIIRTSALGDVAMTIPAIWSLAKQYPQLQLKILTDARFVDLFAEAPANISLIAYDKAQHKGFKGMVRLAKRLQKEHINAVADLHNVLRSWIIDILFFMQGKTVVMLDKRRRERAAILKHQQSATQPFTARYFDVFAKLGFPCTPDFTSIFTTPPLVPDLFNQLDTQLCWIGIAPFARYYNKTYPIEMMHKVVQTLSKREDSHIFLFGASGKESEIINKWATESANIHVVAGRLTMKQELSLMAHLDVMVSMDSANMHLASLVGTRVVSIWGSTTPQCGFLGYGQSENHAVCANLPCQPCTIAGSKECHRKHFDCLASITTDQITDAINTAISYR